MAMRDGAVVSFPSLFRAECREAVLASAALEDSSHNRVVMAFTEKKLLRIMFMTHRRQGNPKP